MRVDVGVPRNGVRYRYASIEPDVLALALFCVAEAAPPLTAVAAGCAPFVAVRIGLSQASLAISSTSIAAGVGLEPIRG